MMKQKKFIKITLLIAVVALFAGTVLFRFSHRYSDIYCDWWVMGKTEYQIAQRYGEPVFSGNTYLSGRYVMYKTYDAIPSMTKYYYIEFDSSGRADVIRLEMKD